MEHSLFRYKLERSAELQSDETKERNKRQRIVKMFWRFIISLIPEPGLCKLNEILYTYKE